jgi:hypothetical protein
MACVDSRPHDLKGTPARLRRYVNDAGASSYTIEVPTYLWNQLAARCGKEVLIVTHKKAVENWKRDKALELIDANWKPIAIAMELGIAETTVRRYKRDRRE